MLETQAGNGKPDGKAIDKMVTEITLLTSQWAVMCLKQIGVLGPKECNRTGIASDANWAVPLQECLLPATMHGGSARRELCLCYTTLWWESRCCMGAASLDEQPPCSSHRTLSILGRSTGARDPKLCNPAKVSVGVCST